MAKPQITNNVLEMIQQKYPGYHPLMSIADIAMCDPKECPDVDMSLRVQCHKIIADKVVPNLKSVEHKGPDDGRTRVTISMFNNDDDDITVIDERELLPLKTVR